MCSQELNPKHLRMIFPGAIEQYWSTRAQRVCVIFKLPVIEYSFEVYDLFCIKFAIIVQKIGRIKYFSPGMDVEDINTLPLNCTAQALAILVRPWYMICLQVEAISNAHYLLTGWDSCKKVLVTPPPQVDASAFNSSVTKSLFPAMVEENQILR